MENSTVLTGNDLAQLANVTDMPGMDEIENYLETNPAIPEQMNYLRPHQDSRISYIHQRSKTMLRNGKLEEAWLNLLAGAYYEEIIINDLINNQL